MQLLYMQARYYDPVIGRFYSNDPVDALSHLMTQNGIHGFNRYSYTNNNPYRYVDPDGRETRLMVEAKHLDMDVAKGNMTQQERVEISKAQVEGMLAGAGAVGVAKGVVAGLKASFNYLKNHKGVIMASVSVITANADNIDPDIIPNGEAKQGGRSVRRIIEKKEDEPPPTEIVPNPVDPDKKPKVESSWM